MSRLIASLHQAARSLSRAPQFTATAAITLALAIGANAAIFGVVQGILLKPLRYPDSDRIVLLRNTAAGLGYNRIGISPGLFFAYRGERQSIEASGIYTGENVNLTGDDAPPERLQVGRLSHGVFATLGVAPALGRVFDEKEDLPGSQVVAVLSDGFWRDRFGSDPAVIGRQLRVDGEARTIVGVMPRDFQFMGTDTKLWLSLPLDSTARSYGNFGYQAIARLRPGVTASDAEGRLKPVLARVREEGPQGDFRAFMDAGKLAPLVVPFKQEIVGDVSRALWILLGTVGFVFLIACANVANLFLVRADARQKEIAVRAALGAGRAGLIGHYLAESVLIAALGGAIGIGLAWAGLDALVALAPPNIPRLDEISLDPAVLLFTGAVTTVAALVLTVFPAVRLTSTSLLTAISRAGRGLTAGRDRSRARRALVVVQTGLALVLLVGSGLLVKSFDNLRSIDPGFNPAGTLTFRISLPTASYANNDRIAVFHTQLRERLAALPGVRQVGATSHPPIAGCCSGTAHVVEDRPTAAGELPPMFWYSTVTPGYFEAMGIRLASGRSFQPLDLDKGQSSVVVSERLARKLWPNGDAIGRRLRPSGDSTPWSTIVGISANVRAQGLEEEPAEMVYYASGRDGGRGVDARSMTYVVRADQPDQIAEAARREVWAIDPNLPIANMMTYAQIMSEATSRLGFTMLALVVAGGIALFLGAIGLYGVISYLVTQRSNELGIRMALGARPDQVRRLVVWQGIRLTGLGLGIGLVAALGLTRVMRGMLVGTEPTDPVTFALGAGALVVVALLATYLPARRASRIDPALSLKME